MGRPSSRGIAPASIRNCSSRTLRDLPLDVPADLPPDAYPLFVTFTDVTKPETALRLDPAKLADAFGPGVKLDFVKLEITSDQVTEGRLRNILG